MLTLRLVLLMVVSLTTAASAAQDNSPTDKTAGTSGKQTYTYYCAACHGVDARGNGAAAFVLKTPPPDLTTLAKRHGAQFPTTTSTMCFLLGRVSPRPDGPQCLSGGQSSALWKVMTRLPCESALKDLSDYLASLQEKDS